MTKVVVVGAGLAGLTAARDLELAGTDVVCLEARDRPGGRATRRRSRRSHVELGGELVGDFHTAYLELAAELGLDFRPGYIAEPGAMTWNLAEGHRGRRRTALALGGRPRGRARVQRLLAALSRTVDPDDPWSHPDAERLDRLSVNDWLREIGASPAARRLSEVAALRRRTGGGRAAVAARA